MAGGSSIRRPAWSILVDNKLICRRRCEQESGNPLSEPDFFIESIETVPSGAGGIAILQSAPISRA